MYKIGIGIPEVQISRTEACYNQLKQDIIGGARPPGERLRVDRLKTIYEVGPTPLREALQRLTSENLVLALDRRGFQVAPLDMREFIDLNIARTEVELSALRLSIRRGDASWEAGIVAAAYLMRKADQEFGSQHGQSLDAWETANREFHSALVASCPSQWLLRVRAMLNEKLERYRRAAVQGCAQRDLDSEHAAIADAVLSRDEALSLSLLERHFARTVESLSVDLGGENDRPAAQSSSTSALSDMSSGIAKRPSR
jgi:GntR family carbon starvation induced transcriptional regulator